jgi:hypothetical protein
VFPVFRSRLGVGWLQPCGERLKLVYLLREPLKPSERIAYKREVVLDGIDDVVQEGGIDFLAGYRPRDTDTGQVWEPTAVDASNAVE